MRRRNIRKFIILVLILCISIGFAVITASLTMNASFSFTNNTFDLHFSNIKVLSTSTVTSPTATITNDTTINYSGTFNKPGDYIEFSFYIVNGGTIDGQINQINTNLTTEQLNYISYSSKYEIENTNVSLNDYIYAGQARKVIAHFEYKEDIDEFIDLSSLNLNLTMKFIQPQTVTTTVWNYEYLGDEQYFIVPKTGKYKLEVWGASGGGYEEGQGGYGGYSSGAISLTKSDNLYINIGGSGDVQTGKVASGGYNGGGNGYGIQDKYAGGGGGATHIALESGLLSTFSSKTNKIIIVAGGGGGGVYTFTFNPARYGVGGNAGGYIGKNGEVYNVTQNVGQGGRQTLTGSGSYYGSFGIGNSTSDSNGCGGGAGYYGGGSGFHDGGCGGGSGYIGNSNLTNSIMYCYNCQSSENEEDESGIKTRSTTHVSETPTSNYTKIGNGYAKITYVG